MPGRCGAGSNKYIKEVLDLEGTIGTCEYSNPSRLWQKYPTTQFASESACATLIDQ